MKSVMEHEIPAASHWRRKIIRTIGVGAVGATLGASMAIAGTSVETEIFPNKVTIELALGSQIDFDMGPLGVASIEPEDPILGGLVGANIRVGGIPNPEGLSFSDIQSLDDLEQYAKLYTNIEPSIEHAINDVRRALIENGLIGGAAGALLLILLNQRYGNEDWRKKLRIDERATLIATILSLAALNTPAIFNESENDTPDQSIYVSGIGNISGNDLVTDLIVDLGSQAMSIKQTGDKFLETTKDSLNQALEKQNPTGFAQANSLDQMVIVSDAHCNVYTASVAAELAKKIDANFFVDLGDSTTIGSAAEDFCFDRYKDIDSTKLWVRGNHDSRSTDGQAKNAGFMVLDGEMVTIDGYTVYGAPDPSRTEIGQSTDYGVREVLIRQLSADMAKEIIAQNQKVDFLLVHDPSAGLEVMQADLATTQLSGHMHFRDGPEKNNKSVNYIASSINGALPKDQRTELVDGFTIRPPVVDVEFITLLIDKETKKPTHYYTTIVHPNGTVSITGVVEIIDVDDRLNLARVANPT